jgi:hypothetical protein
MFMMRLDVTRTGCTISVAERPDHNLHEAGVFRTTANAIRSAQAALSSSSPTIKAVRGERTNSQPDIATVAKACDYILTAYEEHIHYTSKRTHAQ